MNGSWIVAASMLAGWAGIGLAQARQFQVVFGRVGHAAQRRAIGAAGALLVAVAFTIAIAMHGWEFGPVLWAVLLSLGALAWVLLLALDARRAPWWLLALSACMVIASLAGAS